MPINILMPALSPTMTEGNLAKWLKQEGDTVKSGDVIAEIETDKATMEVEAVDEGKIGKIVVPAGTEGVKVNDVIAVLLEEGESASDIAATPKAPAAPAAAPVPKAEAPVAKTPTPTPTLPRIGGGGSQAPATSPSPDTGEGKSRLFASPLARRIAAQQGIDLSSVKGSGPNGRIVRADVAGAIAGGTAKAAPAPGAAQRPATLPGAPSFSAFGEPEFEIIPHTTVRKTIARRLQESKQFVPHFYLTIDCEIDRLLALREEANALSPKEGPGAYKLSVNDFIIKALALALMQVPAANVTWTEGGTLRHKFADVGVAVAIDGGLFTPVIRHAELKSLSEISNEMKDLAERARKRRLAPHEYQGGTTSISNLGMYGIKSFEAVINPPHATILAIGAGEKRPVAAGDKIETATVMACTLSGDHRVVDGAVGAELLNAFKMLLEEPVRMLV